MKSVQGIMSRHYNVQVENQFGVERKISSKLSNCMDQQELSYKECFLNRVGV